MSKYFQSPIHYVDFRKISKYQCMYTVWMYAEIILSSNTQTQKNFKIKFQNSIQFKMSTQDGYPLFTYAPFNKNG